MDIDISRGTCVRIEEVVLYDSKWKLWLLLFHCFLIILNNNKKQEMNV